MNLREWISNSSEFLKLLSESETVKVLLCSSDTLIRDLADYPIN